MNNKKESREFTLEELIDEISMPVAAYAGEAKSCLREALEYAKSGDYKRSEEFIKESKVSISKAHDAHREVVHQSSINPDAVKIPFILIHAEDHLMSVISEKDIFEELISVYKIINDLKSSKK